MPLILGTNSIKDTGYEVDNSCRFNVGSNDFLSRTIGTPTDEDRWTFSVWLKTTGEAPPVQYGILSAGNYPSAYETIHLNGSDQLFYHYNDGGGVNHGATKYSGTIRDPSAWYNLIVSRNGTAVKIYINGNDVTTTVTSYNNSTNVINKSGGTLRIGHSERETSGRSWNGYMSEVVFCDGQLLDQTSFGEFDDSGIWKPIDVSGLTFGNNGFYLDFENSGSLGADVSGNGNNFTVNNLTSIDQSSDSCTNNFATLNPLDPSPNTVVFSEGNLVVTGSGANGGRFAGGTIGLNSGKWWCEIKVTTNGSYPILGIIDSATSFKRDAIYFVDSGQDAINRSGYAVFSNSDIYNNGDDNFGDFGTTYTTGDIIGVGLDMDASTPTLTFQKNGSNEVTVTTEVPPSGFYTFPAIGIYFASAKAEVNFGNSPFSISSGNTDANGYGNFEYAPKTNYLACCTKNLAEYG